MKIDIKKELEQLDAILDVELAKAKVGMFFRGTSAEISIDEIRGYLEKPGLIMSGFAKFTPEEVVKIRKK